MIFTEGDFRGGFRNLSRGGLTFSKGVDLSILFYFLLVLVSFSKKILELKLTLSHLAPPWEI